ncbi:MAG: hypothetical protein R2941_10270 [Desulfobacterales bacterium]
MRERESFKTGGAGVSGSVPPVLIFAFATHPDAVWEFNTPRTKKSSLAITILPSQGRMEMSMVRKQVIL